MCLNRLFPTSFISETVGTNIMKKSGYIVAYLKLLEKLQRSFIDL